MRSGFDAPEISEIFIDIQHQNELLENFRKEVHKEGLFGLIETWPEKLVPLFKPIIPHLEGVRRIVFAPNAYGHLLPWVVIANEAGLDIPWITVPSLWSLEKIIKGYSPTEGPDLVVGNPTGDLDDAEQEAEDVADMLNVEPLIGSLATKKAVLERISTARIIHLATHAKFDPDNPLETCIMLANDEVLKARDVIYINMHPALITLSACETGMVGSMGSDEIVGLSQAFLHAGATTLLVSLWSVDDLMTKKFMINFYGCWINKGLDKAEAFHKAMSEIRKKWPHTCDWAAFVLIGYWR